MYLAWVYCIFGYLERAAKMQARAFEYAAEVDHALTTCMVHYNAGAALEQMLGNVAPVITHADALAAERAKHGVTSVTSMDGRFYKGWAMATLPDRAKDGVALMQESVANRRAKNVTMQLSYHMSLLAEAQARAGDVGSAIASCADAQEVARRTDESIFAAEVQRIEGEVRHAAGQSAKSVEAYFTSALDVSRQQGARLFELRAAISLARLWRSQGRDSGARDLLAAIYGRFTEGFDTVPLKDAKAMLDQLDAAALLPTTMTQVS
jgi:predicted ATPase